MCEMWKKIVMNVQRVIRDDLGNIEMAEELLLAIELLPPTEREWETNYITRVFASGLLPHSWGYLDILTCE